MAEFTYNKANNANTGYSSFQLNSKYNPYIFFDKEVDPRSKSLAAETLVLELNNWMTICQQNLFHVQEIQRKSYHKSVKPKNYTVSNKVLFNRKYIKIKQNWKLKAKFLGSFWVLRPIGKQVYQL